MRLLLSIAAFGMLSLSTSASAYLSRDGERLADGKGNCKVCPTGWRPTAAGNYDCGSPVTSESNCRPAVANVKPRVPVAYDADGRIVETRKKQQ